MNNEDQNIELLTEEPTKEEKAITKKYKWARKKIKLKKNSKILFISLIVIFDMGFSANNFLKDCSNAFTVLSDIFYLHYIQNFSIISCSFFCCIYLFSP